MSYLDFHNYLAPGTVSLFLELRALSVLCVGTPQEASDKRHGKVSGVEPDSGSCD